ncbi:hypothetical protein [Rufibacter aurantiacus]|uniref:hypothetical protein n=1 Tax=Rufibacter aurantiacus TaxID=2817374 RepID=UPI001B3083F9|nr:hypothetical protein [Rufibacter aurantiacus]
MGKCLVTNLHKIVSGLIILALLIGIYFPLGYIGFHDHEPRSSFVIALDQGALFWGTLTFVLTFAFYALFKTRKYLKVVLVALVWAVSVIIFYMSLSDLRPSHMDIAIYENERQEHLIIQYYETGVTGNPRSRLIKTRNINSPIRQYEEIFNASLLDSLRLFDNNFEERLPKVYTTESETYYLIKIHNPWKN